MVLNWRDKDALRKRLGALVCLMVFSWFGYMLLGGTFAAGISRSSEAEDGILSGNAAVLNGQPGASSGAAVQFGGPSAYPFPFIMSSELYHDGAGAAQQFLNAGLANAFSFHAPMTTAEYNLITSKKLPLMYFAIPRSADVSGCYPSTTDDNAASNVKAIASQTGKPTWLFAMPEFDQGGGCWPSAGGGRPRPVADRRQTYDSWVNFYKNTLGLGTFLNQTAAQRGYPVAAACVHAFCPQYAYDMGVDMVLLERIIDEVSGLSPGLAMVRGASKQHGNKPWGIEFSTWRTWTDSPTEYTASGRMTGGWSTSWFKRHWYMAFMGGSNINFAEAIDVDTGGQNGGLNPVGTELQRFGNYALKRHPDRGRPHVPMAVAQDHYSGYEPKFGQYIQGDTTWYAHLPYNRGDKMFSNLLAMIYPDHNLHGTLVPGGPQSPAEYRQRLANGEDPRPWERMGTSRWGETFDIITNRASLATLKQYQAVTLSLGTPISDSFRGVLTQYVREGGVVVINTKEMSTADQTLGGIQISAGRGTGNVANWLADNSSIAEKSYDYTKVAPTTASVIARTGDGSPLITKNIFGAGEVYVTTADYLSDSAQSQTLNVGRKLLDMLSARYAVAHVSGPPSLYMVNITGSKTLVTVVNTVGSTWNGQVAFNAANGTVKEYTNDTVVASSVQNGKVTANVSVPPWDVRVFSLER